MIQTVHIWTFSINRYYIIASLYAVLYNLAYNKPFTQAVVIQCLRKQVVFHLGLCWLSSALILFSTVSSVSG